MKKNVLCSLVALSAVPMATFADANISSLLQTSTPGAWGTADQGVVWEEGTEICVSQFGNPMKNEVKNLLPGKYTFAATTVDNAVLKVNGKVVDNTKAIVVELKSVGNIAIEVTAAKAGELFKAGGFSLKLNYDFVAMGKKYSEEALLAHNKLQNVGPNDLKVLDIQASEIQKDCESVMSVSEVEGYNLYKKFELYKGDQNLLMVRTNALAKLINQAAANKAVHDKYEAAYKAMAEYVIDFQNCEYARTRHTPALQALKAEVAKYKDFAAYEGKYENADYAVKYGQTIDLAKVSADFVKNFKDLQTKVDASVEADKAYNFIVGEQAKVKEHYLKQEVVLKKLMLNAPNGANEGEPAEQYKPLMDKAAAELADKYNWVYSNLEFKKLLGTKVDHETAAKNKAAMVDLIAKANAGIDEIAQKYNDWYVAEFAAFKNAMQMVADLNAGLKAVPVNSVHEATRATIQKQINDLNAQIHKDNQNFFQVKDTDYSATRTAIQNATKKFAQDAGADLANLDAFNALRKQIADLNKALGDAQTAVGKLVKVGSYEAKNFNTTTAIVEKITAEDKKVGADYKADKKYAEITVDVAGISALIKQYQNLAVASHAKYKEVYDLVKKDETSYAKLKETVANWGDVDASQNTDKGATYAEHLAAYKKAIDDVNVAMAEACKQLDKKHNDLVMAIQYAAQKAAIDGDNAQFAKDKETYIAKLQKETAIRLWKSAVELLQTKNKALDEIQTLIDTKDAGLQEADFQKKLDALKAIVAEQKAVVDKFNENNITNDNANEASKLLKEVNDVLKNKVNDAQLRKDLEARIQFVWENNKFYDNLFAPKGAMDVLLKTIEKIKSNNEDPNRANEFQALYDEVKLGNTKLELIGYDALAAKVLEKKKTEVLVAWWNNDQTVDKKVEKSLKSVCEKHQVKANESADKATASTKNWKAYQDVLKHEGGLKFDEAFATIINKIQKDGVVGKLNGKDVNKKVGAEAGKYYLDVVINGQNGLKKQLEAIQTDYKKSYNAPKRSMVNDKQGYVERLNQLLKDIKALETEAFNNQVAYEKLNGMVKPGAKIYEKWESVYNGISATDKNPFRDQLLEELVQLQKQLDKLYTDVDADFAQGNCDDNEAQWLDVYNKISSGIDDIDAKYKGGYDEAIAKANEAYKAEIGKAYNDALGKFKAGAKLYEEYRTLIDPELRKELQPILDAASIIYPKFDELNKELAAFNKGYDALIEQNKTSAEKHVYDYPAKQHLNNLNVLGAAIDAAVNQMRKDAKAKAESVLNQKKQAVQNLLDAAVANLVCNGQAYKTADKAFQPQRDLIKQAEDFASKVKYDYAVDLDNSNLLARLRLVKAEDFDYNAAAKGEWAHFTAPLDKNIAGHRDDLMNNFIYPADMKGAKQQFINEYNKALVAYYWENDQVERTPSVNFNNLQEYVNDAQTAYNNALAVYNKAKAICFDVMKSNAAYENLVNGVENKDYNYAKLNNTMTVLDAKVAELKAYADPYVIALNSEWQTEFVASVANAVADKKAELDRNRLAGNVHVSHASYVDFINAQLAAIGKVGTQLFERADNLMIESLENQGIKGFKHEYNQAIVAGTLSTETLNKYAAELEACEKELAAIKAIKFDEKNKYERHDRLVALQSKIAKDIENLSKEYGRQDLGSKLDALKNRVNTVNQNMTAVENFYNAAHGQVKKNFATDLAAVKQNVQLVVDFVNDKSGKGELLFFSENVDKLATKAETALQSLKSGLETMEAKYDAHDAAVARMERELSAIQANFQRIEKKVAGYKSTPNNEGAYVQFKDVYKRDFKKASDWVAARKYGNDDVYVNWLNKNSVMEYKSALEANNDNYETVSAVHEFNYYVAEMNAVNTTAVDYLNGKDYIEVDGVAYGNRRVEIWNKYAISYNFFVDLYNRGEVLYDVDGNKAVIQGFLKHYDEALVRYAELAEAMGSVTEGTGLLGELEANYIVKGDADADKEVSATDFSKVVNAALDFEGVVPTEGEAGRFFARVDMNNDNRHNVGDVVAVANKVVGGSEVRGVMNLMAQQLSFRALAEDNIAVAVEGEGTSQRIAISLNNSVNYVAGQMDIVLPAGVTLLGESLGERASQHDIYTNDLSNGAHRVILANMDNVVFDGNGGAVLYLDVQVSHNFKGEGIEISNIKFSDAGGRVYDLKSIGGEATGIGTVTMTDELKSKIYNVGGQLMNSLKKGVNIIRNSNGTTKKVVK